MKEIEIAPIKENPSDFDLLEVKILQLFRKYIYLPLLKEVELNPKVLKNSREPLLDAIRDGKIYFNRGEFKGSFSASISRELKEIGAKFDRSTGTFKIPLGELSPEIKNAISLAESRVQSILKKLDDKLGALEVQAIAEKLTVTKIFDMTLWKLDKSFQKTLQGIIVTPTLTDEAREKIADGYTKDLQRYIVDFTNEQILDLRESITKKVMKGERFEGIVKSIKRSYGVSQNKAKFLARQETGLMMAAFKKARYQDVGIKKYKWGCVAGSKDHPVRPMHKALEHKEFSWDYPPVTSPKGDRNNPGEDYNCRCFARPIVKF